MTESIQKKRIEWVDIAKGIAIVLVCLGHRNIPGWLLKWIYSFHMPVFFFLAGYTTRYSSYKDWGDFLKRKTRGLIIPYLSLGLVYILVEFIWALLYKKTIPTSVGGILLWFAPYFRKLFLGRGIGSSWFIVALLVVEFIAYGLSFVPRYKYLLTALLGVLGFWLNSILTGQLLWNINTAMVGLIFFEAAQATKENIERIIKDRFLIWPIICVSLLINIFCTVFNSTVDMFYLSYGNKLLFLAGAFSGISFFIFVSVMLQKTTAVKRVLIYYGCNTFPIIEFHYAQGYMITETLFWKLFKLQYGKNALSGNVEGFIHVIAVLILLVPVIEFFNRFAPWMVGKR